MGLIFIVIIIVITIIFISLYNGRNKITSTYYRNTLDNLAPHNTSTNESTIVKLAKKNQGKITPLEVVAETHISIQEAEDILKNFVNKGYVDLQVTETGKIYYVFPDFLPKND